MGMSNSLFKEMELTVAVHVALIDACGQVLAITDNPIPHARISSDLQFKLPVGQWKLRVKTLGSVNRIAIIRKNSNPHFLITWDTKTMDIVDEDANVWVRRNVGGQPECYIAP